MGGEQCSGEYEDCKHIDDAANRAVKKVFAILGVDIDKPESVEEFREDLRFGRRMRKAADHGFLVFVGVVIVAIAYAMWEGIKRNAGGGA